MTIMAPWMFRTRSCHSIVLASGPMVNRSTSVGHSHFFKLIMDCVVVMYTNPMFCTIGSLCTRTNTFSGTNRFRYFIRVFRKLPYLAPTRVWNRVLKPAIIMAVDSIYAWAGSSGKIQNFGAKTLVTNIKPPMAVITFCKKKHAIIIYTVL